jgi:uncharacterized protein involved in type VI secretion and phage assembly
MSKVEGVALGTVKAVNGDGEIQVTYRGLPGLNESRSAPVATMMAGASRGCWMMPEIGDEALVAFRNGNVHEPYVIGFLWNGEDQPPDSDAHRRIIRTRKGHAIALDDTDQAEKLEVRSSSGLTFTLDDTPGQEQIRIEGGGRRIVMAQGKVEFF